MRRIRISLLLRPVLGTDVPMARCDCLLGTSTTYCAKNRMKKSYFHSSDEAGGSRNVKLYNVFGRI